MYREGVRGVYRVCTRVYSSFTVYSAQNRPSAPFTHRLHTVTLLSHRFTPFTPFFYSFMLYAVYAFMPFMPLIPRKKRTYVFYMFYVLDGFYALGASRGRGNGYRKALWQCYTVFYVLHRLRKTRVTPFRKTRLHRFIHFCTHCRLFPV